MVTARIGRGLPAACTTPQLKCWKEMRPDGVAVCYALFSPQGQVLRGVGRGERTWGACGMPEQRRDALGFGRIDHDGYLQVFGLPHPEPLREQQETKEKNKFF